MSAHLAACTGFTQHAVCAVADMMYNRCEAVRGADVCSCPCGPQSCPLLSHLPPMSHKAGNNLASSHIHVYLCAAASKSLLNAVMCYNLSIPLTNRLPLTINTLQDTYGFDRVSICPRFVWLKVSTFLAKH